MSGKTDLLLPEVSSVSCGLLNSITKTLGIPRDILASEEDINYAWQDLPRELSKIPPQYRDDLIAKMCVSVSCGLFDSAINYVWNSTILFLRQKVADFGLPFIGSILERDFDESTLNDMQDSQLLDLTLKLNIISEDAFFFLDQCRNVRNSFSAAHPTIGKINDREFITFLNRCIRYALAATGDLHGIDINECIKAVKNELFTSEQMHEWGRRLHSTCDAQRQLIFPILHGIYCDPATLESARTNALALCSISCSEFSGTVKSNLINKHSEYLAKGDTARHIASRKFFEEIGLLNLLTDAERHSVISNAVKRLWIAHEGLNNFYNEKHFAEQLCTLLAKTEVPNSAKEQLVYSVVNCYLGNGYGVAHSALPYYESIIKNFSPKEIEIMLSYFGDVSSNKLNGSLAKSQFIQACKLLLENSVPTSVKSNYEYWKNK